MATLKNNGLVEPVKPPVAADSPGVSQGTTYLDEAGNKKQGLYTSDLNRYNTIQQMKNLSAAWHTSTPEQRKALADQAYVMGTALGASRDKEGVWWYGGQHLYDTIYQAPEIKPPEVPNYYEDFQQEIKDFQDQQETNLENQYAAALEAARLNAESQKGQVTQQYDDMAKQLYIQRRMSEKALPEQMSAMGYNGGLTESSALNLQTSYAEALRQGETERINTIAALDNAIRQAELEGNQELAAQLSALAQNTMGLYSDALMQIQNQANWNAQMQYQAQQDALAQQNWYTQFLYNGQQDALDRNQNQSDKQQATQKENQAILRENAWMKLQSGSIPTAEELAILGMTQAEAQQIASLYKLNFY